MRRVDLGEPLPGLDQGRPLPAKPGESEARRELRRSWLARFTVDGERLHPEGLAVLRDLSRFAHGGETTARMDDNSRADALAMAIAEGRRQALLFVLGRLGLAPLDTLITIEKGSTDHDDSNGSARRQPGGKRRGTKPAVRKRSGTKPADEPGGDG